jgi:pilus assembly protein FimV
MRTGIKAAAAGLLMLALQSAAALGLGPITVNSHLNEPLRASIPLLGTDIDDVDRLVAFLAAPEQFRKAGLERPFVLALLKFDIISGNAGPERIDVTSARPIREPVLNFIIELAAPEQRVFQQYSVLLDPGPAHHDRSAAPDPAEPAMQRTPGSPPFEPPPLREQAASASYGPIGPRETLWSIAAAVRPDEQITVQQMMLALVRRNPEAFTDGRMDGLREGTTLAVPSRQDILAVPADEAFAQVQRLNQGP